MNSAKLDKSDRLQRVLALLADGKEHTTRDILDNAHVGAVSPAISELRDNGLTIHCRHTRPEPGKRVCYYRLDVDAFLNSNQPQEKTQ